MAKKREQGFAATVTAYNSLMGEIKKGVFQPFYLLHGEESYFIDRLSDAIESGSLSDDERDFNFELVYGADYTAADIINMAKTYPMMSERRVIIVREATQLSEFGKLESYFASPVQSTVLVICYKGKSPDKRSSVYKKAASNGVVFDSVKARDYEVKSFISKLTAARGCTIDPKAAELIVEHLGSELIKIDNEVIKLLNAMGEGEKNITTAHIEKFIGISKDYNVFELTDALSVKNRLKILTIADYFKSNPKNNPVVMVLPSLFRHFLSIYCVGMILLESKRKGGSRPDNYSIAKTANLPGPYFVDKYISATNIYPVQKSLAILGIIREYDMKSKGINGGSLSEGELLRELLLKIITI